MVSDFVYGQCKYVAVLLPYQAYAESHKSDPPEIGEGFKELEEYLCTLPLEDNNAVFNLCCRLCAAYEHKAFLDGLQYGAHLMSKLFREKLMTLSLIPNFEWIHRRNIFVGKILPINL